MAVGAGVAARLRSVPRTHGIGRGLPPLLESLYSSLLASLPETEPVRSPIAPFVEVALSARRSALQRVFGVFSAL